MSRQIELNPVSQLTIGTVGEPGNRTFFLQGSQGGYTVSLVIEKEQAVMLVNSFESLLEELDKQHPTGQLEEQDSVWTDMRLREPIEDLFRVGNMGLGYNEASKQVVLVAYELVEEGDEPSVVSFWATRLQVGALIQHALDVVKSGRPICGNCGRPIDADGHFCPQRNGHKY